MASQSDADINFDDLCSLLARLGFQVRTRGDHHIFIKDDIVEITNVQSANAKAKPYQVRQVRKLIRKYRLNEKNE